MTLTLTPTPTTGTAPLSVTFARRPADRPDRAVAAPVRRRLADERAGPPPTTVAHAYATNGIFDPTLIVYAQLPFAPASSQFLVSAEVTVGTPATKLVDLHCDAG